MSNHVFEDEDLSLLNYTNSIRKRIISNLAEQVLPNSKADLTFLISALDGMDRNILGKTKIVVDESVNKSNGDVTKVITELLIRKSERELSPSVTNTDVPYTIDPNEIVDGERDVGISNLDYNSFMNTTP